MVLETNFLSPLGNSELLRKQLRTGEDFSKHLLAAFDYVEKAVILAQTPKLKPSFIGRQFSVSNQVDSTKY